MYCDADFAGDRRWSAMGTNSDSKKTSMRSTSGCHIALNGTNSCFPLIGASKKQEATSYSTPEAEMVAGTFGLRTKGLPFLDIAQRVLQRNVRILILEDNTAMLRVCQTGKNPTMRHLGCTHGMSVAWMHENTTNEHCVLQRCDTTKQCADIYTKGFNEPDKWRHACNLINVIDPHNFSIELLTILHADYTTTFKPLDHQHLLLTTTTMLPVEPPHTDGGNAPHQKQQKQKQTSV